MREMGNKQVRRFIVSDRRHGSRRGGIFSRSSAMRSGLVKRLWYCCTHGDVAAIYRLVSPGQSFVSLPHGHKSSDDTKQKQHKRSPFYGASSLNSETMRGRGQLRPRCPAMFGTASGSHQWPAPSPLQLFKSKRQNIPAIRLVVVLDSNNEVS